MEPTLVRGGGALCLVLWQEICATRHRHDPGDICATIWIHNLSPLYLTTLDRDLDGMVILGPLVRRPLRRLLFILSFMLSLVLLSGGCVCFDVLGRMKNV